MIGAEAVNASEEKRRKKAGEGRAGRWPRVKVREAA